MADLRLAESEGTGKFRTDADSTPVEVVLPFRRLGRDQVIEMPLCGSPEVVRHAQLLLATVPVKQFHCEADGAAVLLKAVVPFLPLRRT